MELVRGLCVTSANQRQCGARIVGGDSQGPCTAVQVHGEWVGRGALAPVYLCAAEILLGHGALAAIATRRQGTAQTGRTDAGAANELQKGSLEQRKGHGWPTVADRRPASWLGRESHRKASGQEQGIACEVGNLGVLVP
jgi:hypothetical protein